MGFFEIKRWMIYYLLVKLITPTAHIISDADVQISIVTKCISPGIPHDVERRGRSFIVSYDLYGVI